MKKEILTLICTLLVTFSNTAYTAIISTTGDITLIGSPVSVEPGQLESSTNIFTFAEQQSFALTSNLSVDLNTSTMSTGTISSGTTVNSYFIHSDPIGDSSSSVDVVNFSGTVTFDTEIIGLIWTGATCADPCPSSPEYLDASDFLGAAGSIYPTGGMGRGYEMDDYYAVKLTQDFISLSADLKTLSIDLSASTPLRSDQLRIITATVVPIPAAFWLFGSGLLGLLGVARRKAQ